MTPNPWTDGLRSYVGIRTSVNVESFGVMFWFNLYSPIKESTGREHTLMSFPFRGWFQNNIPHYSRQSVRSAGKYLIDAGTADGFGHERSQYFLRRKEKEKDERN